MVLKIKKLDDNAVIPKYAHPGEDACFDMSVLIDSGRNAPMKCSSGEFCAHEGFNEYDNTVDILPNETAIFRTGLAFEIESGYAMKIYVRSSTGFKKHLILANGTGIIDSNYRGEVLIALTNTGKCYTKVHNLDKLVQAEIVKIVPVEFEVASELTNTSRGANGFGSTGN